MIKAPPLINDFNKYKKGLTGLAKYLVKASKTVSNRRHIVDTLAAAEEVLSYIEESPLIDQGFALFEKYQDAIEMSPYTRLMDSPVVVDQAREKLDEVIQRCINDELGTKDAQAVLSSFIYNAAGIIDSHAYTIELAVEGFSSAEWYWEQKSA